LNLDNSKDNKEFFSDERKLAVPQVQEIPSASKSPSKIGTVETVIKGSKNFEANGIDQPKVQTATKQKVAANKTTYAIQLGVFNHKVGINSKYFKGITPIKEISFDGKFKYFCSESNTFQATKSEYAKVVRLFPDAFIVSIQNDQTKMVWKNGGSK
jgi:hypothetical protein